jgi:hypothetical protein
MASGMVPSPVGSRAFKPIPAPAKSRQSESRSVIQPAVKIPPAKSHRQNRIGNSWTVTDGRFKIGTNGHPPTTLSPPSRAHDPDSHMDLMTLFTAASLLLADQNGLALSLADTLGMTPLAYAVQTQVGYEPDRIRIHVFSEDAGDRRR